MTEPAGPCCGFGRHLAHLLMEQRGEAIWRPKRVQATTITAIWRPAHHQTR